MRSGVGTNPHVNDDLKIHPRRWNEFLHRWTDAHNITRTLILVDEPLQVELLHNFCFIQSFLLILFIGDPENIQFNIQFSGTPKHIFLAYISCLIVSSLCQHKLMVRFFALLTLISAFLRWMGDWWLFSRSFLSPSSCGDRPSPPQTSHCALLRRIRSMW